MTDIELGFLAGIFEGEGSLFVSMHHGQWMARVAMADEDVVRNFHQRIGIGNVTGPVVRTTRKDMWRWQIGKQEDLLNFVALFTPLMGTRRADRMTECLNDLVR